MRALLAFILLLWSGAAMAAQRDWTQVVTVSPIGGFIQGNPNAPVKVVEYASYTCPHCAHFSGATLPRLQQSYVRAGQVSVEFRSAVRDRYDFIAAVLARCAGSQGFFPTTATLFARQGDWMVAASDYEAGAEVSLDALPPKQRAAALVKGSGVGAMVAATVPAAKAQACLADDRISDAIGKLSDDAWKIRKIPGTPYVLVNDVPITGVADWPELEARIGQILKK
ncbi:thioredoxin domain-containing protein [Sphingomonas sp. ID0503]|uniref:thioredoxin domain-containing protein n=1 Tax=Sphingomonas sp. ID0503 TaxID=3399691 RepID=UPI003AFB6065